MDKRWCKSAAAREDGLDVRAGITAQDPPEYSMTYADEIETVGGLIFWLQTIAHDGDRNVDRDTISDTCDAAAKRLQSMQDALRQEVDRIEKLQPFYTQICAYVDGVRKQTQRDRTHD